MRKKFKIKSRKLTKLVLTLFTKTRKKKLKKNRMYRRKAISTIYRISKIWSRYRFLNTAFLRVKKFLTIKGDEGALIRLKKINFQKLEQSGLDSNAIKTSISLLNFNEKYKKLVKKKYRSRKRTSLVLKKKY